MHIYDYISLFTLGVATLFPIVNPVGTSLIVQRYFFGLEQGERKKYVRIIIFNCLVLGVGALLLGSWCLKLMGVSTVVTQFAGGIIIARMGLGLLDSKEDPSDKDTPKVNTNISDSLFYPIAFPLTVGPGVVSTLITLSAHAHVDDFSLTLWRMLVLSGSLLCVLITSYFFYVYADLLIKRIGKSGSDVLNRLMSFLVFCIGLQMAITGLKNIISTKF